MKTLTLIGLTALPGLIWTSSTLVFSVQSSTSHDGIPSRRGPIHQQFAAAPDASRAQRLAVLAMASKDPVGYDLAQQLQEQCDYARKRSTAHSRDGQRALALLKSYCRALGSRHASAAVTSGQPSSAGKGTMALMSRALEESEQQLGCEEARQLAAIVAGESHDPFEVRSAVAYLGTSPCGRFSEMGHRNAQIMLLAAELAYCDLSGFCEADTPYTLFVCLKWSACQAGRPLVSILSDAVSPQTFRAATRLWHSLRPGQG
ncbi:MAG: hypothetical protein QNJ40_06680 [Xanthomonadales bacterium]|nr:hypothetical protein [Xanthomonadales bacterium]